MRPVRMIAGVALFLVSSWVSPYMADILGIPEEISFLMVGGILSFAGGILFYSGVKYCTCSYQY